MEDKSKADYQSELDYFAAEQELKEHKDEPRSQYVTIALQPFTLVRLRRYLQDEKLAESDIDEVINEVLKSWLYGQGF